MALVFALRHLCGEFLCERNDRLGESRVQKLILVLVGLLGVLEARDRERSALRKGCGLEICRGYCSKA